MGKASLPSQYDLRKLPLRAIVAFATRCAQRVHPFVVNSTLEHSRKEAIANAIHLPTEFAGGSEHSNQFTTFTKAARDAADAARDATLTFRQDTDDIDDIAAAVRDAALTAALAASAAANAAAAAAAALAADAVDDIASAADATADTAALAASAATYASAAFAAGAPYVSATEATKAITEVMATDYEFVAQQVETKAWRNDVLVPLSLFGDLWPKGAPVWPLLSMKGNELGLAAAVGAVVRLFERQKNNLEIDLWIDPGNVSAETLQRVFVALSELHIAAGGTGLEFKSDGDFVYVRELVPV